MGRKPDKETQVVHIGARTIIGGAVLIAVIAVTAVWTRRSEELPQQVVAEPVGQVVSAPAGDWRLIAPTSHSGELYLATDEGLYHTVNDGMNWSQLSSPLDSSPDGVTGLAVNPSNGTVYVAGNGFGVQRSDDRGLSWTNLSGGLPSEEVAAFAMHTYNYDTLYAHIGSGIFETRDGGATWREPVDGPPVQVAALGHSTLPGSMNTGWLYSASEEGLYLSMD